MRRFWQLNILLGLALLALVAGSTLTLLGMAWLEPEPPQPASHSFGENNRALYSLLGVRAIETEVEIPKGLPFLLVSVALIEKGKIVQVPLNNWSGRPEVEGDKVKIGVLWGQTEDEWKAIAYTQSSASKVTNSFFQHLDSGANRNHLTDVPVDGYHVAGVATSREGEGHGGKPEFPSNYYGLNDYGLLLLAGFYPDRETLQATKFNEKRQIRRLQEGLGYLIDPAKFTVE